MAAEPMRNDIPSSDWAPEVPSEVEVIVLGGGIVGASVAYSLAVEQEIERVLVLDEAPLFHTENIGIGRHPLVQAQCPALFDLVQDSAQRYATLSSIRGHPCFYRTGEIQVARTPKRLRTLQSTLEHLQAQEKNGVEGASVVTPADAALLHPLLDADSICGALYYPPDAVGAPGRVCPTATAEALAFTAIKYGAQFIGEVQFDVLLREEDGRIAGLKLGNGDIIKSKVVVFAGALSNKALALASGLDLPLALLDETTFISNDIDSLGSCSSWKQDDEYESSVSYRPVVYDLDADSTYVQMGTCVGLKANESYGGACRSHPGLQPWTASTFAEVIPALGLGVPKTICKKSSVSPDGLPLVGPWSCPGLYVAESTAPDIAFGVGRLLARWINTGHPGIVAEGLDVRRFGYNAYKEASLKENAVYSLTHSNTMDKRWDKANAKLLSFASGIQGWIVPSQVMYELPEVRKASEALWSALVTACEKQGVDIPKSMERNTSRTHALSSGESLLLSQCCTLPLAEKFSTELKIVAIPKYSALGCSGAVQKTAIVVNKHRASYFAASWMFQNVTAAIVKDSLFSSTMLTAYLGGTSAVSKIVNVDKFEDALSAVRNLEADVAAIDSVLFELLRKHRPAAIAEVSIVGYAPFSPSMPLVTSRHTNAFVLSALRNGLKTVCKDPQLRWARNELLIDTYDCRGISNQAIKHQLENYVGVSCESQNDQRPETFIKAQSQKIRPGREWMRPILIETCLTRDIPLFRNAVQDLKDGVSAAKGSKLALWFLVASSIFAARTVARAPNPIVKFISAARFIANEHLTTVESRIPTILRDGRTAIVSKSRGMVQYFSRPLLPFLALTLRDAAMEEQLEQILKETFAKQAYITCITQEEEGGRAVFLAFFRYSRDALNACDSLQSSGPLLKPCIMYVGNMQAKNAEPIITSLKKTVVWYKGSREGSEIEIALCERERERERDCTFLHFHCHTKCDVRR